jgi:hypothetical protein
VNLAEAAGIVAAVSIGGAGLFAVYRRTRDDAPAAVALLTIVVIAAATPLWAAVLRGRWAEVMLFSAVAAVVALHRTLAGRTLGLAALVGTVVVVSLLPWRSSDRPTLFEAHNGFLALTPVVYLGVVGALARARHATAEAIAAITALALWPLTSTPMTPAVALLAPGVAAVLDFARRRPLVAATPLVAGAIVWNYWLMVQYTAGQIPKDAPVSFAAMVRQQADVHTRPPYFYPFAFPGNAVSAWREGVPLLRYDTLSAQPRHEMFSLSLDRAADPFLLGGWSGMSSNATGPFRQLAGVSGTLLMPLTPAARDYDVSLLVAPRGDTPVHTTMHLEINRHALGGIVVQGRAPVEVRWRISASEVGRVLRAGYNRVTIVPASAALLAVYHVRLTPAS